VTQLGEHHGTQCETRRIRHAVSNNTRHDKDTYAPNGEFNTLDVKIHGTCTIDGKKYDDITM
jgi:hypothetical protein